MRRFVLCLFGLLIIGVGAAQAQVPGDVAPPTPDLPGVAAGQEMAGPEAPDWGISDWHCYVIPGYAFNNLRDAQHGRTSGGYIYNSDTTAVSYFWDQTFHLPSGALVEAVRTFFYDADGSNDLTLSLYREAGSFSSGFTSTLLLTVSSSGSGGYQGYWTTPSTPETVRNYDQSSSNYNHYLFVLTMNPSAGSFDLRFGGVAVWYHLQVSPGPAIATFADVPTGHWAFKFIEALADSGITGGCGGGNYCPDNPITRAEMAVFLSAALGLNWPDG